MKTLHLNQFKTVLVCGLLFVLQSCVITPGTWKNEQISSGKRDDFHKLNDDVLKYLKANDPKGLRIFSSKEMNERNNARLVDQVSNRLTDNEYSLLDEYYVVHKYKDVDTVATKSGSVNRYNILYPYIATEMYMAYFIPKKPKNKDMISLVYAKFNYGWKIVDVRVEPYTINGKTAPELYALSRKQYDDKQYQAALNNVSLAVNCFEPGAYWEYPDRADAKKLYGRLKMEVNARYRYPLVLKQINTGPMILRVYTMHLDDGTYPMVYYMTHFDLKDTTSVKKENLEIRKVVAKLMPGMEQNNRYILYSAFNKQPSGYVTVNHFDMQEKVN